ncbi:MAG: hypothetical protein IT558_03320 [Alphaproteobacteria bacterium]|nr:hypothetical protein [Alphaproteobacteria bacterium]
MIKTGTMNFRSHLVADSLGLLLAGCLVILLGGCAQTNSMRTTLAPPPPQMMPETAGPGIPGNDLSLNEIASGIEPAAGTEATLAETALVPSRSCMRIGQGGAFAYQWGDNRLGLGFGSSGQAASPVSFVAAHTQDSAQAFLRFDLNLQPQHKPACD